MAERDSSYPLLSVEEALERFLARVPLLPAEPRPILECLDRVLAEDVMADRDVPPLANSAMDGYALRAADLEGATAEAPVRLDVIAELPAGKVYAGLVGPGQAVRIMTGAPIPGGADTVVRFEDVAESGSAGDRQVLISRPVRRGSNVRQAGEDVRAGQVVLPKGTRLRPQEIGMLASVGRVEAMVYRRPRVAILGTGDELVSAGEQPGPGQIRDINSYACAAQALRAGATPILLGIAADRRDPLAAGIRRGLEAGADLFITSGGVSVGDFDLVKRVLATEGQIDFWWVNMKPGKPLAFGSVGGVPLLGLPGNPVAAMISFDLFARPALRKMQGFTDWTWPELTARLASAIERKDGRRHYLRVRLHRTEDGWQADLTGDQGSGILNSMVQADGLAVIPEQAERLPAGAQVRVLLLE
jgi:molybdopterin molybdotransferase